MSDAPSFASPSRRPAARIETQSTITCPACEFAVVETMPINACQYLYDCKRCGERMKAAAGDCCVFCTFGSVPCPPVQKERFGPADG